MFSAFCRRTSTLSHFNGRSLSNSKPRRQVLPALTRAYASPSATSANPVTKLERIILDNIKATGPVTFANYMQYCLSHPTEGYYMKPSNSVFGSRGDFITSPEISQVFGELLGIWLLSTWMQSGASSTSGQRRKIRLVELGPGRGTLMEDILRVLSQFPASREHLAEVHLVETSQSLREAQKAKLSSMSSQLGCQLLWHDMIEDIHEDGDLYTMLIAHEFFDALPFHLLEKTEQGWHEVFIASTSTKQFSSATPPLSTGTLASSALDQAPNTSPTAGPIPTPLSSVLNLYPSAPPTESSLTPPVGDGSIIAQDKPDLPSSSDIDDTAAEKRFHYVLSPTPTTMSTLLGLTSPRYNALPVGARVEVSVAANRIARKVAQLLSPSAASSEERVNAGAALIVDYGDAKAFGDSFRAFKEHKIVDVFHRPGECDLTANVDFAYLSEALSEHALPLGPLPQGTFLERMGLALRVERLKRDAPTEERRADIDGAAKRLVDQTGMGKEYKVLGVVGMSPAREISVESEQVENAVWPFVQADGEGAST